MVRAGNKYVWPNKTQLSWQSIEDILVIMSKPKLVNNRVQFKSQSDSLEKANLKARSLPAVKNISFKQKQYFFDRESEDLNFIGPIFHFIYS